MVTGVLGSVEVFADDGVASVFLAWGGCGDDADDVVVFDEARFCEGSCESFGDGVWMYISDNYRIWYYSQFGSSVDYQTCQTVALDMATFIPPTYTVPLNDETQANHGPQHSLWRHYQGVIPTSYSVLITSGAATAYPGTVSPSADDIAGADTGSGEGGLAWFRGGIAYTVTAGEASALTTAGYSDYLT